MSSCNCYRWDRDCSKCKQNAEVKAEYYKNVYGETGQLKLIENSCIVELMFTYQDFHPELWS